MDLGCDDEFGMELTKEYLLWYARISSLVCFGVIVLGL